MSARIMLGGACALGLLAAAAMAGPQPAEARECAVKPPPNATGHWVYRTVEGRKCWYRGPEVIPRSELHWPKDTADSDAASAEPEVARADTSKPDTSKSKAEAAKSETGKPESANPVTTMPEAAKLETEKALDANAQFLSPVPLHYAGPERRIGAQHTDQPLTFDARWRGEPR